MMTDSDNAPGAPEVPWDEVRRRYEDGEWPVSRIRAHFGLTDYALKKARIAGGWAVRDSAVPPGRGPPGRPPTPKRMAWRLARALAAQLAALEARIAEQAEAGRAPEEPDLRAIADIAEALERLARAERTMAKKRSRRGGGGRGKSAHAAIQRDDRRPADEGYDPAHVAWMRAELKRRLAVLARASRGGAGGGDRDDGAAGA